MESRLGLNPTLLSILLPILIIAALAIIWLIAKARLSLWRRIAFVAGGLFALFGFAVAFLIVYYQISPIFADTFRFYAYSALAPAGDPFQKSENGYQTVIMMREVSHQDGRVSLLYHPNPEWPTIVYLFTPGKFITADLKNDTLTIPAVETGSLPMVIPTSLWWALTRNIHSQVSSVD